MSPFEYYYEKYTKFYGKLPKNELVDLLAYQNAMLAVRRPEE